MLKLALRFMNGASGARAIEYGLIAAGILVAIIVTLPLLATVKQRCTRVPLDGTQFLASTFRSRSGKHVGRAPPRLVARESALPRSVGRARPRNRLNIEEA